MVKIAVTIPTYWSWETGKKGLPEDSIFDHPTPLDKPGTLDRTLNSLESLAGENAEGNFFVIIITAPVNKIIAKQVEHKVEKIIEKYRSVYPIAQFGPADLEYSKGILLKHQLNSDIISLDAYAQIRNCQLFSSAVLDADLIAAIDDDEVVPPNYLNKAVEFAGGKIAGERADGIAGIYLNASGDYRLKGPEGIRTSGNIFIKKAALMNDEFSRYMNSGTQPVKSSIALGGNMVFTRELFLNVPFDPGITRGEDIDYLINSKMLKYNWFFDRDLFITHLPPDSSGKYHINTTPYAKLQQDIIRFIYEKEKIRLSSTNHTVLSIKAEDLGIYPGEFLKDGLEAQALEALREQRPPDADERFFPKPERLLKQAAERAEKASEFFSFADNWEKTIDKASQIKELKDYMNKKLDL